MRESSPGGPRRNPSDRLASRLTEGSTPGAPLPATWPVDGAAVSIALLLTAAPQAGCAQLTDRRVVVCCACPQWRIDALRTDSWITDLRVWKWTRRPQETSSVALTAVFV